MTVASQVLLVPMFTAVVTGVVNLALNKPSYQPSTYFSEMYSASKANDGNMSSTSCVDLQVDPYWQLDLEDMYLVTSITVTSSILSNLADDQLDTVVGVSVQDARAGGADFDQCGQWPGSSLIDHTITFNCVPDHPVRYVRLYRTGTLYLCVAEVEVQGCAVPIPGMCGNTIYTRTSNEKIVNPISSVSAESAADCGIRCYHSQPCVTFSYSHTDSSCLLATETATGTDDRMTYKITYSCP